MTMSISVTITIEREHDGRTVKSQALLHENGWQQWGEIRDRLTETVPLVEALQATFMEHVGDLAEWED